MDSYKKEIKNKINNLFELNYWLSKNIHTLLEIKKEDLSYESWKISGDSIGARQSTPSIAA